MHSELSRCLFAQHQLLNSRSHEQRIETSHLPELKSKLAFERSFAPIQKNRSGIFAACIFHLSKMRYGISTLSKTAAQTSSQIPRFEENRMAWTGFVQAIQSRYVLLSFLLRPSADGAPRRATCPSRAAPRLQAPELGCLGLPWRSRRVGPAR